MKSIEQYRLEAIEELKKNGQYEKLSGEDLKAKLMGMVLAKMVAAAIING